MTVSHGLTDVLATLILAGHICICIYRVFCVRTNSAHTECESGLERSEAMKDKQVRALKAHLALNVHSVDRSIRFYKKMLGIEPSKVRKGYAKFDVQNPPLNFTLNQAPFTGQGALSHLGIQVATTEDVNAMRDRWEAEGLVPREEKQ